MESHHEVLIPWPINPILQGILPTVDMCSGKLDRFAKFQLIVCCIFAIDMLGSLDILGKIFL